jgi:hypothetical protein
MKMAKQHQWLDAVKRLTLDVQSLSSRPSQGWERPMISLLSHLITEKGPAEALRTVKSYNTYLQMYALKQKPANLSFHKVDKEGFPKVLKPWKVLIKGNQQDVRFCLSLWRLNEVHELKPKLDLGTVVGEPVEDTKIFNRFSEWLPKWKGLTKLPSKLKRSEIVMSNKAGPNGPATASAINDLHALRADEELNEGVGRLLQLTLPDMPFRQYRAKGNSLVHSKIVALSDKYGKTRIVAIGDFWSNTALSGIHRSFMLGLSRIVTDCTYNQSSTPKLIKALGEDLYSSDLTAFTDRFPRKWQMAVIAAKYGTEVANLWNTVIAERTFSTTSGTVKYATGNPMGLLSSWPVSTFTHHAFIEWCASEAGESNYQNYLMLGDDNICSSSAVSAIYKKHMQSIGVSISHSKSTSSEQGYAEFAKRLFTPEGEITGVPATLLKEVRKQPEQLIELVKIMRERGYKDNEILTGVQALTARWKNNHAISLVLSAPSTVSGCAPLKGVTLGNTHGLDPWSDGVSPLEACLARARQDKFWTEVAKIGEYALDGAYPVPNRGKLIDICEDHPMLTVISDKLTQNYMEAEDEYSVYRQWMDGNGYELAQVPNVDVYRYKNRGHKVTKAKYDIIRTTFRYFKEGIPEDHQERPIISNVELFILGFPKWDLST